MYTTSKQRFVGEYANYKIRVLEDLAKACPDKADICKANIAVIKSWLKRWEQGYVLTDEIMAKIASI